MTTEDMVAKCEGSVRITRVKGPARQNLVGQLGTLYSYSWKCQIVTLKGETLDILTGDECDFRRVTPVEISGVTPEGEVFYGVTTSDSEDVADD